MSEHLNDIAFRETVCLVIFAARSQGHDYSGEMQVAVKSKSYVPQRLLQAKRKVNLWF